VRREESGGHLIFKKDEKSIKDTKQDQNGEKNMERE
jgi:hypothetical protein